MCKLPVNKQRLHGSHRSREKQQKKKKEKKRKKTSVIRWLSVWNEKNDFFLYVQYIFMNSFLIPIAKSRGHGVINMDLLHHNNDFVPSSVEFWPCDFGVDDENLKSLEYQKFLSFLDTWWSRSGFRISSRDQPCSYSWELFIVVANFFNTMVNFYLQYRTSKF